MRPPEHFTYDPDTGDLRWAIAPTENVRVGDPVGFYNTPRFPQCRVDGRNTRLLYLAHWLNCGTWREDIMPANGNWSDLRAVNIVPRRGKRRRNAKADHFNATNVECLLGSHRITPMRAKLLLKVASARRFDPRTERYVRRPVPTDELIEVLWPDPDTAPLTPQNNIAVHMVELNKCLVGWRIVRVGSGPNKGLTLKEIEP